MKKIISLISLLAVGGGALTPVLMTQNMSHQKSSYGYTPPPGFHLVSKFEFTQHQQYDPRIWDGSYAQYYHWSHYTISDSIARYQVDLTRAGAEQMWSETTSNWPASGHPATNYMYWLNANAPGWNSGINESGDYIISIEKGAQGQYKDNVAVSDFEKNIGGSLWNKIEAYIKSKSTADLELSFQYNGIDGIDHDGFYTNATWSH